MAVHSFLYDDACPMCKGYTGVFSKLNWSERKAFSSLGKEEIPKLDLDRGRHEIPLINLETHEVRYGLDAMTMVIGNALPRLKPLVRHRKFIASLKPLYWLITYNRRVIAGTKPPKTGFDCAPDYHSGWRYTYVGLMLAWVLMIGLPALILTIGFAAAFSMGVGFSKDRLTFLGHFVTVLFLASCVCAILPGYLGGAIATVVAVWEGWRRS